MKKFTLGQLIERAAKAYSVARGVLASRRRKAHANGVVTKAEAAGIHAAEAAVIAARNHLAKRKRQGNGGRPPIIRAIPPGEFDYVFGEDSDYRGAGHYSAGPRARNMKELVALTKSFHRYHKGQGWGGCSYEYLIADDGSLVLANPVRRKSAAVLNQNTGTINVNFPGTTGDRPTKAQQATFNWLLDNAHTAALPEANRAPSKLRGMVWKGHKNFPGQSTACPGEFTRLIESKGARR